MSDETYNGWKGKGNRSSAYATWRVALELFSDYLDYEAFKEKPETSELADYLREQAEEFVFANDPNQERLVSQYAAAFLDDVNWYEIAENHLEGWPGDEADDDE